MMYSELVWIVIGIFFLPFSHALSGHHSFPLATPEGEFITNELQLIQPANIIIPHKHLLDETTYTLTPSPLVISNNEVVTVSFSSSAPSNSHWIAAYSPANVNISQVVPIKYGWCDEDPNFLTTGNGILTFNMTNVRADIKFVYFTNYLKHPIYAGESDVNVTFYDFNEQLRPRIIATGDYDRMNVLWSSYNNTAPTLQWGLQSGIYQETVSASTKRIEKSQMGGTPASTIGWRDLGLIHTANLTDMKANANKKIYYRFGDAASNKWSREYIFHAPPLPGTQPPDRGTRVILYDDMGTGSTDDTYTWNEYGRPAINTTMAVTQEIIAGKVDGIYHGGDISYATGYIPVWDFYMNMLSPIAAATVYLITIGNHESDCPNSASYYTGNDSGGECGVVTTELLPMPSPAQTNTPWWSYDIGLIHFVGMSTEHDYTIGSPQYNWIESDLASVDRAVTPWVIFGGHRAMYINSNYGGAVTSDIVVMDNLIENIEPLLWKYKVNVAFWGHNHVVQRMSAVLNKTVIQEATMVKSTSGGVDTAWHDDPQATVHMVIGTAGASFTKNAVYPYPVWCEEVFYRWGYAAVEAVNATYLDWTWFESNTSVVYDHMVIIQKDPFAPFIIDSTDDDNESNDDDSWWSGLSTGEQVGLIIGGSIFALVLIGGCIAIAYNYNRKRAIEGSLLTRGESQF